MKLNQKEPYLQYLHHGPAKLPSDQLVTTYPRNIILFIKTYKIFPCVLQSLSVESLFPMVSYTPQ